MDYAYAYRARGPTYTRGARRKLFQASMAAGVAFTIKTLPQKWKTPVVNDKPGLTEYTTRDCLPGGEDVDAGTNYYCPDNLNYRPGIPVHDYGSPAQTASSP